MGGRGNGKLGGDDGPTIESEDGTNDSKVPVGSLQGWALHMSLFSESPAFNTSRLVRSHPESYQGQSNGR